MTHYDYGFRIYNPGIGRFLSVDPLTKDYPWYTPYQFAGNTPIQAIDVDGAEPWYHYDWVTNKFYLSKAKIGPIPLEEANSRGLFTQQQAHGVFESQNFREQAARQQQIRSANNQLAQHQALTWNPIWNLYQVSPIKEAFDIGSSLYNEEYGQAVLATGFAFIPLRVPNFTGRGMKGQVYFRKSKTSDGIVKPYFGKTYLKGGVFERYAQEVDLDEKLIAVLDFEGGRSQLKDIVPELESLNFKRMEFIDGLEGFLIDLNGNLKHSDGGILANDKLRFTTRGPNKPAQLRDIDRLREFFSDYLDNNYKGDWRSDFDANNYTKK